jgi:pyruvate carboxylase subunit B
VKYVATVNDRTYIIEINDDRRVVVDGVEYAVDFETVSGQPVYTLLVDGRSYEAFVYEGDEDWQVMLRGNLYTVPVSEGQPVKKGDNLVILESMKMQNELKSPREGTVMRVRVNPGDSVEQNQVLVTVQ